MRVNNLLHLSYSYLGFLVLCATLNPNPRSGLLGVPRMEEEEDVVHSVQVVQVVLRPMGLMGPFS